MVGLVISLPLQYGCAQTSQATSEADDFLRQGNEGELLRAAADGDLFKIDKLLATGVDINTRTPDGATPLMGAVYYGYAQTSRLLMERGADVNARNDQGVTALHYAAQSGRADIARDLLEKGADPAVTSAAGNTPLALAQAAGHREVVELLQAGAPGNATGLRDN